MISGAFSLVNVLGDMSGPGTLGIKGDSQAFYIVSCKCTSQKGIIGHLVVGLNFQLLFSALITLCFILLHVCWSLILYLSLSMYTKKSFNLWLSVAIVVGSHLFVSGIVSSIQDQSSSTILLYLTRLDLILFLL